MKSPINTRRRSSCGNNWRMPRKDTRSWSLSNTGYANRETSWTDSQTTWRKLVLTGYVFNIIFRHYLYPINFLHSRCVNNSHVFTSKGLTRNSEWHQQLPCWYLKVISNCISDIQIFFDVTHCVCVCPCSISQFLFEDDLMFFFFLCCFFLFFFQWKALLGN